MFGRVVDMKTLGNLVGAITSAGLVILPVIFSLRRDTNDSSPINSGTCALSNEQQDAVQGMFAILNVNCTYNVSVGPDGVEQWRNIVVGPLHRFFGRCDPEKRWLEAQWRAARASKDELQ